MNIFQKDLWKGLLKWPATSRQREVTTKPFALDTPLLYFSPVDYWSIRQAEEGVSIMGAIGSGKTSGSGAAIAKAFLRAGFGGLVMCAKPEERELWEEYARETGREKSLIIFSPEHDNRFNFLEYELRREGRGGGQTENLVNIFSQVIEIVEGKMDIGGGDPFWSRSMNEMLRSAIDLLSLAKGRLTIEDICRLIAQAPQSPEEVSPLLKPAKPDKTSSDENAGEIELSDKAAKWLETSFCAECLLEAGNRQKSPVQQHDYDTVVRYWLNTFPNLSDRTRSNIVITFTSIADMLLHGVAWSLLATDTTIVPELTYKDGALIVLDLPIQEMGETGRVIQGIFKYMFQRAILRRNAKQYPRPVFLWADEAQNFVSSYDFKVQAVARSALLCSVYLSQSISNYYAVLGANGREQANALLGNFVTKVFHSNSDHNSNQYACDLIGQHWTTKYSVSHGPDGRPTTSTQETLAHKVLPEEFTTLRKGGPQNALQVEGIVFQGGRIWNATGHTYLKAVFRQE